MSFSVETEKTVQLKDRKVAGIAAFTAFAFLLTLLCFIGYRISNPPLSKPEVYEEMAFIPFDPQILEQAGNGSLSGTPAKTTKAETTPLQTAQVLTQQNSAAHTASGNSDITNTNIPNNNPSGAKHVSDNPFGTGGINGGKYLGNNPYGMRDDQKDDPKQEEKKPRQLVVFPNTDKIACDENCKIALSVTVDPEGNIVEPPTIIKSATTTTDMNLIHQVISIVKSQAKYNKVNTTRNTKELIVIRINAN